MAFLDRVAPLPDYLTDAPESAQDGPQAASTPEVGTQGSASYWLLLGVALAFAAVVPLALQGVGR
jgi:hypothetical protein